MAHACPLLCFVLSVAMAKSFGCSGCAAEPQARDTADDEQNADRFLAVQPLAEEQCTQQHDPDTRGRGPDRIAHADVEGQECEAEKRSEERRVGKECVRQCRSRW